MFKHQESLKKFTIIIFIMTLTIGTRATFALIPSSLQNLTNKIYQLQQNLSFDHHKKIKLSKQLSETEQQIQANIIKLQKIQQSEDAQQQKINALSQQIDETNTQINNLKTNLIKHINTRYMIPETSPIQWFIKSKQISHTQRLTKYYQYIIQDEQETLHNIQNKTSKLVQQEQELKQNQLSHQKLHQEWLKNQNALLQQKTLQIKILKDLNQTIDNKQLTLSSYEKNKQHLSHIITKLSNTSVLQTKYSFTQMQHKLPNPVEKSTESRKFHQGVLFNAKESTPVYSVYPGKVVFADWLNGYGLLIIIDHGWGFMTLYSNNKSLFKHQNDVVKEHELIAHVGHTGELKKDGLYFEIRHHGKAISPNKWLLS